MNLQEEFDNQLSETEKELFMKSETAYYMGYSKFLEQRLETRPHETGQVDAIVIRLDKDVATKLKEKADWEGMTESDYIKALMQKTPFVFSH